MKAFLAVPLCLASLAGAACASGSDEAATTAQSTQQSAAPGTQEATGPLRIVRVASGLDSPLHLAAPRSEPNRLYVVEQAGRIRVIENGRVLGEPFLDVRGQVGTGSERGLLSVAFHPNYARNRRFYVNFTDRAGDTRVIEFRSDSRRAVRGSERLLLRVPQPYSNHNGGQIAFGADGRLYVGMGDGGSAGDPENRAQNPRSLLGKLLSINVATKGVRIEALGLRNPWRFSFDRATGDLYLGDVGQGSWEEVDYLPRRSPGLENFGWSRFEGRSRYSDRPLARGRYVPPVVAYSLAGDNCAVTGGFVYRGAAVQAARGRYFYGDNCSGVVWSLKVSKRRAVGNRREPFPQLAGLVSFGEDARGELYLVTSCRFACPGGEPVSGTVYRLAG